jgi:hypothetical protein
MLKTVPMFPVFLFCPFRYILRMVKKYNLFVKKYLPRHLFQSGRIGIEAAELTSMVGARIGQALETKKYLNIKENSSYDRDR